MNACKPHTAVASLALIIGLLHLEVVGAPSDSILTTDDVKVTSVPDKRIVDCLLQGQIRKLGSTVYQLPPRPVRLPAIDCEIRGGDFLAYDRASFATSLSHWLNLAKQGDVSAMVYVGEIFERGLGREPDFVQAANWYRQAADGGSPVAQISLAQLHEKGLGVPRDPAEAARLYQLAFGPGSGGSVALDPGSIDDPAEKVRELEAKLETTQREAQALKAQLVAAEQNLDRAQQDLERQEQLEHQLKNSLAAAQDQYDAIAEGDEQEAALKQALERTGSELREQQEVVSRLRDEIGRNRRQIEAYEADFARIADLETQLMEQTQRYEATSRELEEARTALSASNQRLAEQQRVFDAERKELEAARAGLNRANASSGEEHAALQAELKDRESRLNLLAGDLEKMRREVDTWREQSVTLQDEMQFLREQNSQLAASREEAELYQQETERLKVLLAETQAQLVEIESEPDAGAELDRMQAELQRVREEADRYRRRIEELETVQASNANLAGPSIQLIEPAAYNTRGLTDIVIETAEQYQIVGKVTAPAGVLSVTVNQQPAELNESNVFRSVVGLAGETTPIHIAAIDNQGKRAEQVLNLISEAARLAERRPRLPSVEFGRFHALLIGNQNYEMLPDLVTPKEDVRQIGAILSERYGFQTTIIEDGSRQQIMDMMYELLGRLTSEDNLLIYYAGHGEYVTDTERGVWLPVDANPSSPANWINNVDINDYLKQIRAKQIVVIADSCYSGALTRSALINVRPGLTEEEYEAHLEKMAKIRARVVLTSGALAPVLDSASPGSQHSIFAAALIEILNQNQAVLSAQDLGRTIAAKVSLAATRIGYDQEPQYAPLNHANHQGGDFFFVPKYL